VKSDYKLEIVTLHPSLVIGPTLLSDWTNTLEYIARFIRGDAAGIFNVVFPMVDVRDVALSHYLALITPGISGERFIIS